MSSDPKLVEMTAEPTTTLLQASWTTELGIRIKISGNQLPDARRPALNLGLVLDTSGSMEGDAIDALRSSAKGLVEKLRDGDRLSIVTFDSHSDVLVPNTVITRSNRPQILHAIELIRAKGTTDLVNGLAQGLSQVVSNQLPAGINRIVLLSDGVPNSSVQLPAMLASIHQNGISVTSLGFGIDYDTTLMAQIARDTGGSFKYIEKPDQVAAIFDHELTKMTTVVGRNLQLVLEPGPGVTIEALPGLQASGDGKFYTTVGDLPAGEVRDLMIPIKVSARAEGTLAELVQASLTFEDVIGHSGAQKREAFVGVRTSNDLDKVHAAIKMDLEAARVRSSAAAAILQAITLARQGQVAPARQTIAAAIAAVKAAATRLKDADFSQLLKELENVGKQVAQVVAAPQPELVIGKSASEMPKHQVPMSVPPAMAPPAVEPMLRRAEEAATANVQGRER
ncbi:MAG: hypothetical protein JWO36_2758 [Myxococcales bacterium]|nr:hypothetical protein [Myxococcales bacterium]